LQIFAAECCIEMVLTHGKNSNRADALLVNFRVGKKGLSTELFLLKASRMGDWGDVKIPQYFKMGIDMAAECEGSMSTLTNNIERTIRNLKNISKVEDIDSLLSLRAYTFVLFQRPDISTELSRLMQIELLAIDDRILSLQSNENLIKN
jgi:hypothetical protein